MAGIDPFASITVATLDLLTRDGDLFLTLGTWTRRLKRLSAFSRVTANVFSSEGVHSFLFTSRGVDPHGVSARLKRGGFRRPFFARSDRWD